MKNRPIAIIDLGTNTFHLLIKQLNDDGTDSTMLQRQFPVRLGQEMQSGFIHADAFERGLAALTKIKEILDELKIQDVVAFGTSVFRNALNAYSFTALGAKIIEAPIQIIDGYREANLIYTGVAKAVNLGEKPSLIMDIGGGSVEFIIGNSNTIFWSKSYELGGITMSEKFHLHDPMHPSEIESFTSFFTKETAELQKAILSYKPCILYGAAGCFETFSKMEYLNNLQQSFPDYSLSLEIEIVHFTEIAKRIKQAKKEEILSIPGMSAFRINLIVVSAIMVETVLKMGSFQQLFYSNYSLKEGIFYQSIA